MNAATPWATDDLVRRLAADWHGGMNTALYRLASTGSIVEGIDEEIGEITDTGDRDLLVAYVVRQGFRGPQEGWVR